MATKTVTVKVTTTAAQYWVAVDDTDLAFSGDTATIQLEEGPYWLAWWLIGAPASPYKIELFRGAEGESFLTVELAIAKSATKSAGVRLFKV